MVAVTPKCFKLAKCCKKNLASVDGMVIIFYVMQ